MTSSVRVCHRCGSTYETSQEARWWIADDERSPAGGIQCGCAACKGMTFPEASDFRTARMFKTSGPSSEAAAAAANKATLTDVHRQIWVEINRRGDATADEVAQQLGLQVLYVRPRVTELFQNGWLEKTGARRPSSTGSSSTVWRVLKRQKLAT